MKIFNNFEVDELIIVDLEAARGEGEIRWNLLKKLSEYSSIPLSYGGGIQSLEEAKSIIRLGFEKIVVASQIRNLQLISELSNYLGAQAVTASVDILQIDGVDYICSQGKKNKIPVRLMDVLKDLEESGIGEILLQDVHRDGTKSGLNHELFKSLTKNLNVPTLWKGGLKDSLDAKTAVDLGASGVAATTYFVYNSNRGSTLISYPYIFRDAPEFLVENNQKKSQPKLQSSYLGGKMCQRCVITEKVPGSKLNVSEICYYCLLDEKLNILYPTGEIGKTRFQEFCKNLKSQSNSNYHCILGVSGGTDSSYLAMKLVEEGVRPLAVHFDNTWNTSIASSNIHNLVNRLNLDLETFVVDNNEYDVIIKSFLKAGVVDLEAATDIGFMGHLYRTAEKYRLSHIVEGHSFRTEGISPIGWLYMDGKYIENVVWTYAKTRLESFTNISLWEQLRWAAFGKLCRTRPLYWLEYDKNKARKELEAALGWKWYGGHHLENNLSAFFHSFFLPYRFGIDYRQVEFSALVRSGQMSRDEAVLKLEEGRIYPDDLITILKDRLDLNDDNFLALMNGTRQTFRDFKTYKRDFERLKPLFYLLMKSGKIPESFYHKYCLPLD
jgi:imidazole glycerol phosphate synthase subunit HisF